MKEGVSMEDTIDIRVLFDVIKKQARYIYIITTAITLTVVLYLFLIAKPVYEVKAMLEIGEINTHSIENIQNIKQKLMYEYKVNEKTHKKIYPRVKSVEVPKKSNSILSISVYARSNPEALEYMHTITSKILHEYKEKTDAYILNKQSLIKLRDEAISSTLEALNIMKKDLEEYNNKIVSLEDEDGALAGIYALQIGQKQKQMIELQQYIVDLKNNKQALILSLSPLKIRPTQIVGDVVILEKPIKPKKGLIIVVSFITALMLSIFFIFFLEFIQAERKDTLKE